MSESLEHRETIRRERVAPEIEDGDPARHVASREDADKLELLWRADLKRQQSNLLGGCRPLQPILI